MPNFECPGNELLIEYAAGRLRGRDRVAAEHHLGNCSGCRDFVGRQQAVFHALDAWEDPAVPADFDRRLQERLFRPSWRERAFAALRPALTWKALPIAAAAGLAVVAVLVREQRPAPAPPPQAAVRQIQPLPAEQVESASQDLDVLREWEGVLSPEQEDSEL